MHKHAARRRPAQALEPPVDEHEGGEQGNGSGDPGDGGNEQVHHRRQGEPQWHEVARVGAVREHGHEEFAQPVGEQYGVGNDADADGIHEAVFLQDGGNERDVVPDEVERRVSKEDSHEDVETPCLVCFVEALLGDAGCSRGRGEE